MLKQSCVALVATLALALVGCGDDERTVSPAITGPASIANGIVGTAITPTTITVVGTAPITFAVSAGTLPPGITLDPVTGTYAGTPTAMGVYNFTITATNKKGSGNQAFSQTVLQRPTITGPASPLPGTVGGVAANAITFAAGGSTPITWSVTAGALPPGMALNATTGAYTGTPTGVGTFSFTITATNAAGTDSDPYMQTVTGPAQNAHALINGNRIAALATSFPAGIDAPLALTGVAAGESIVSIDRRPRNGFLYGLGYNPTAGSVQLYTIAPQTGVAVPVGPSGTFLSSIDGVTPVTVGNGAGTSFGIDFNPTVDRLRVVNSAGQNFRMNPNTGGFVDGNAGVNGLNMDGGINGPTTTVQETAYTNSVNNPTATTQYAIDASTDALCIQNPPNNGTQTACQPFGVAVDSVLGFDISPTVAVATSNTAATGTGTVLLKLAGQAGEVIAPIDLANGMVGTTAPIVTDGVLGLALQSPQAVPLVGLTADGTQLLRFTVPVGGQVSAPVAVPLSGVAAGEVLVGIDYRPQTGQLYALGVNDAADNATLYLLDPQLGVATIVGGGAGLIAFVDLNGVAVPLPPSGYGFDFNPTVDRVRVVTDTGLNFRVNPNNGAPVDGNAGVANTNPDGGINALPAGSTGVSGTAYTNSFGQSLTGGVTTQYVIDAASDQLFIQNPPNNGTLTAGLPIRLGGNPLDFSAASGFDIPSDVRVTASNMPVTSGVAYAALTVAGAQHLYVIDLATGNATDAGVIATALAGLAVGQVAVK